MRVSAAGGRAEKRLRIVCVCARTRDAQHVVAKVVLHNATQDVKGKVRARVSHVAVVVHRRSARVPAHAAAVGWDERLNRPGERVAHLEAKVRTVSRGRFQPLRVHALLDRIEQKVRDAVARLQWLFARPASELG